MATTTLNIRMDPELKKQVDDVSKNIGITSAAAFNVFARQYVAHRGFPFQVTDPVVTEQEFSAQMDRIYRSMKEGNESEHELAEA